MKAVIAMPSARGVLLALMFAIGTACGDDADSKSSPSESESEVTAGSGAATAGTGDAPETLAASSEVSLFLYTEPNFKGTRKQVVLNQCREENQFVAASMKAAPGFVCFAYAGPSCTGQCEVCVDDQGWPNTDQLGGPFVSGRCERADAAKCSNADCSFK